MSEAVDGCSPSTPSWSASSPTRRCTPTRRLARRLGRRYAELAPIVGHRAPSWRPPRATSRPARELAAEDPSFADEATELAARAGALEDQLRELLVPRDPDDGKDVILEVKAGEGGEESALFAGDLLRMYLRYAERRGWKTEILDADRVRPRRLQGRHRRGQAPAGPTGRRLGAAEVRGRRAPGPAGAGHRVAGPDPHLRRRRARAARGRGRRRPDRPERPAHRRLPLVRARRAERQHHRLRRPDHPPADRHRRVAARTRSASCRTGSRRCGSCAPGCSRRPRRRRTRRRPTHAAPRSARSTAPSGSAPTTSRRTGSPTTGSATRPTTSTRCSTASSDDVIAALRDRPTRKPLAGCRRRLTAAAADAGRRGGGQPRHDAEELAATCSGCPGPGWCCWTGCRPRPPAGTPSWSPSGPPGSRCST